MGIILAGNREVKAQDILKRALRLLRVYNPGEPIPGAELEDNLSVLNSMLDYFSLHGLLIVATTTEGFPLTALDPTYTIGTDEDFDTTRPMAIDAKASFIRDSSGNDYPLLPMTEREYNAVSLKVQTTGSTPERIWYNAQYPEAAITLDPAPSAGLTLYLVSEKPFNGFDDIATAIEFPPGYQALFEWNLAVWLAPEYGERAKLTPKIEKMAQETRSAIEARNFKPIKKDSLGIPAGSGGGMTRSGFLGGSF